MNIEQLQQYCLSLPEVTEGFPFGEDVLVFKAADKIFALAPLRETPLRINLKCHPDLAILLRDEFPEEVIPGYHMNKKHWNTVLFEDTTLSTAQLKALVLHSYHLVVSSLPKKTRETLLPLYPKKEPQATDFWEWE